MSDRVGLVLCPEARIYDHGPQHPLRPERVLFARELPKTRSAKIMRRVVRATYLGKDPGDLSSLDNPGGVKAISDAQ